MTITEKELIFEEEARKKLKEGIDTVADVISSTLGPKGRNVGLDASYGAPRITNDGNSITKEIEVKDPFVNMGVSIGKEVSSKMKEKCGDGTTTSVLLLKALVDNGIKNIASGSSPIRIKRGIDKAVAAIAKALEKMSTPIIDKEETRNIATASASGDAEIGNFIANAFEKVGKEGVITIEQGKGRETTLDILEGGEFPRGYISSYFCTNRENFSVELTHLRILITDKKITSIQEILPLLQTISASGTELLIIADDIEGDALSTLVINKIRGTLKTCAVKAPGFGDQRKALLEDIAILTGATLISEEIGVYLKDAAIEHLGSAEKAIITKEKTTLINAVGSPEMIKERIAKLDAEAALAKSSYDKEKLLERKAKLQGGVAVIRVGATSEVEMKQKKQIFEDSLSSTRAALEEGIVAGGGVALLRAAALCEKLPLDAEELIGAKSVFKACEAPLRQIIENTGYESALLLAQILSSPQDFGFNAMSEKLEDLRKSGILDPTKVVKQSLINAASAAGIVLLSECLISKEKA
jgi:chaperonin GroEL